MKKCLDCNKIISRRAIRCHSCAKKGIKNPNYDNHECGKNHPSYKHGKTHNNSCQDCGKLIWFGSKRCSSCWGKMILNKLNPNWQDGLSRINYSIKWTDELRNQIRKRDEYICQLCGKIGKQVHHIDYNKTNCNENNLTTLCRKCHCKTNFNRDYWFAYFKYIKENYNGCL